MSNIIDEKKLRALVPANALRGKSFKDLLSKTLVQNVSPGKVIFKEGDKDNHSVYVIDGQVSISSSSGDSKVIIAGSEIAKHPIANNQPRKYTAKTKVDSKIIRIDNNELDSLVAWDQLSTTGTGMTVDELGISEEEDDGDDDWMTRILQTEAFQKLPPANIQELFMCIEDISVKAGAVIIKQGDEGDFYYIIKSGQCKVTRSNLKTGKSLQLAVLKEGDGFGEEALLSEEKRNANVMMLTNGSLMRLSKTDFNKLLKEPVLALVSNEEAQALVKNEGAIWLDVRLDSEHKNSGIEGSMNIPLFMLRLKLQTLDPKKPYILYCNTGRQSSACAFLLSQRGFQIYCLKDGLVGKK